MSTELIDTAEIARILGVSRAHCVGRLIKRPDFPRPAANAAHASAVRRSIGPPASMRASADRLMPRSAAACSWV